MNRNQKFLIRLSIAVMVAGSGCGDDDDPAPVITEKVVRSIQGTWLETIDPNYCPEAPNFSQTLTFNPDGTFSKKIVTRY